MMCSNDVDPVTERYVMEITLFVEPEPEPQQDEFWPFPKQTKDLPGEPEFNLENFEDAPL